MKRPFLSFLLCFLAASLPAFVHAQEQAPEARLRGAIDQVLDIATKSGTKDALIQELRPVLEKYLCFESMTRRAVGPGWRQFSSPDRTEATHLFATLIIRTYSERINPGERPVIHFGQTRRPSPDKAEITTRISYKGSDYEVIYRMEKQSDWRVTDVIIEGVSLVSNYRAQFDGLFKKGGTAAVLDSLHKSVGHTP